MPVCSGVVTTPCVATGCVATAVRVQGFVDRLCRLGVAHDDNIYVLGQTAL